MYAASSADVSLARVRENDESSRIVRLIERMLTRSSLSCSRCAPDVSSRLVMFRYKAGCRRSVICLVAGVSRCAPKKVAPIEEVGAQA